MQQDRVTAPTPQSGGFIELTSEQPGDEALVLISHLHLELSRDDKPAIRKTVGELEALTEQRFGIDIDRWLEWWKEQYL